MSGRTLAVIGGATALAVVAVAGVILVPKYLGGPSDPGCKAYADTALGAYNKAIDDLNAEAPKAALDTDMATVITDLTNASAQAQSTSATSTLNALLAEFKVVRADVVLGSVPKSTVVTLNADSAAADKAC